MRFQSLTLLRPALRHAALSLMTLAVCTLAAPVMASEYPWKMQGADPACATASLKPEDAVRIAAEAGMWKPAEESWIVKYAFANGWSHNTLQGPCIWVIQTLTHNGPGGAPLAGEDTTYVQDGAGKAQRDPMSATAVMRAKLYDPQNPPPGRLGIKYLPRTLLVDESAEPRAEHGPLIVFVQEGSPAYKAGVMEGDELMTVNGQKVASYEDIEKALAEVKPNTVVLIQVWRNEAQKDMLAPF